MFGKFKCPRSSPAMLTSPTGPFHAFSPRYATNYHLAQPGCMMLPLNWYSKCSRITQRYTHSCSRSRAPISCFSNAPFHWHTCHPSHIRLSFWAKNEVNPMPNKENSTPHKVIKFSSWNFGNASLPSCARAWHATFRISIGNESKWGRWRLCTSSARVATKLAAESPVMQGGQQHCTALSSALLTRLLYSIPSTRNVTAPSSLLQ